MTDPPCSFTHLLGKPFPKGIHILASSCILQNQQKFPVSQHSKEGPQRAVGTLTRPHQRHCPLPQGPDPSRSVPAHSSPAPKQALGQELFKIWEEANLQVPG